MFCVVAPQCTYPPASPSQTRSSSQMSGTSGWPVRASPACTASRSMYERCAFRVISSAALAGMMPKSAWASASAASTSSHAWKRAASVNSARTPGSSIRNEVGSSCILSASSVGMDQCQLTLAQSPFQQTVRFWCLLAGIHPRDIGINRAVGNQGDEVGYPTGPHIGLAVGVEDAEPGPAQAFGPQFRGAELRLP